MKFIKTVFITLLLICNQSCTQKFQTKIISEEKLNSASANSDDAHFGTFDIELLQNEKFVFVSACRIFLKKIKWRDQENWTINDLSFSHSKLGGFYLFHSPPVIYSYEVNKQLNFIIDIDIQIAHKASKIVDISSNGELNYVKIQDNLKKLLNETNQIDTIKITGNGSKILNGTFLKMKKRFLLQNSENGLSINEIDSFTNSDLENLKVIFGIDSFTISETTNLPKLLKYN